MQFVKLLAAFFCMLIISITCLAESVKRQTCVLFLYKQNVILWSKNLLQNTSIEYNKSTSSYCKVSIKPNEQRDLEKCWLCKHLNPINFFPYNPNVTVQAIGFLYSYGKIVRKKLILMRVPRESRRCLILYQQKLPRIFVFDRVQVRRYFNEIRRF